MPVSQSMLMQDLTAMENHAEALDRLIDQLRTWHSGSRGASQQLRQLERGRPFLSDALHADTRGEARDWDTGLPLKADRLGQNQPLPRDHHIFPKSQLYTRGHDRPKVNSLATYCFLTQATNLDISNTLPEVYFPQIEASHPGALSSQWVPMDQPSCGALKTTLTFWPNADILVAESGQRIPR